LSVTIAGTVGTDEGDTVSFATGGTFTPGVAAPVG